MLLSMRLTICPSSHEPQTPDGTSKRQLDNDQITALTDCQTRSPW